MEEQIEVVPVTVYVVEAAGPAFTTGPLDVFNPMAGDHAYVEAPLAIIVIESPKQIVAEVGLKDNAGTATTVIVIEAVAGVQVPLETVTV
jgi:hypothetical protein